MTGVTIEEIVPAAFRPASITCRTSCWCWSYRQAAGSCAEETSARATGRKTPIRSV